MIRYAEIGDALVIHDLILKMTPIPGKTQEKIKETLQVILNDKMYRVYVATVDDLVVGTCMMHFQYKLTHRNQMGAHIEDLVVYKDFQGQGIGKLLLQTAIAEARLNNCYKVILNCFEHNIKWYGKFGFTAYDYGMKLDLV